MQGALRVTACLLVAALAGCQGEPRPSPPAPAASRPAVPPRPQFDGAALRSVGGEAARRARAVVSPLQRELAGGCERLPSYLSLREHIAAAAPYVRTWAPAASEVLLGPVRPGEGAGALGQLDAALEARDCVAARGALTQIERALTLATVELADARPTLERGARVLSEATYELGLHLAAASPSSGATGEGALADARGTLAAVSLGAAAYGDSASVVAELAPVAEALASAASLDSLPRRAWLVRATGRAGAALRRLASTKTTLPRALYVPLVAAAGADADAISPFSLPRPRATPRPELVSLGAALFADKRLSRGGRRACAGCHQASRAFADGLRVAPSLDATPITRNTPSLSYAYLGATQRADGRVVAPEDQALSVLHTGAEMGLTSPEIEALVRADASYATPFEAAFPTGVTASNVAAAIGAYVETLGAASSRLDRFARFEGELSADEAAGFDVFAGKGRCARCHVPPLFGGSRPLEFQVPVFAVLGVPATEAGRAVDADEGRGAVTSRDADRHAFKTPSLRNVVETAPYFHNGSFRRLDQVIDFYDRGGGKGRGIVLENQDPDVRALHLSAEERRTLLVFLAALSDAKR